MPTNIKKNSIQRTILVTLLSFVFVFVYLSILYIANAFSAESKHLAEKNIIQWTQYIAELSVKHLQNDNSVALAKELNIFKTVNSIQYISIYAYQAGENTQENILSVNTIYDHITGSESNPTTTVNRIYANDIAKYVTPLINNNLIEYVSPIKTADKLLGYVFVQIDMDDGLTFNNRLLMIYFVIFIILVVAVYFISTRLEHRVALPLKKIGADLLHISQTKDFAYRIKEMPYKEADIIARNINNFLNRAERHVTKLGVAEQQSLKLTIELEDKVNKRTQALKESNQELLSTLEKLHQFQDQLVESEKMASLGDMVAGVAHEVNTPIGLGVTASTLLSDRLLEIKSLFEDKTLKSSQLKKFLDEGEENVGIIYRNLKRAAELILSFKKVAVDQSSEEFRQFNFAELFNEILFTLAPQLKHTPFKVEFDCPDDLLIVSKPGPINQIMINLILNSIKHGFDKRKEGVIHVVVMKLGEQLNINFTDNGQGIDPMIKDKIFEPFTTTKRGEGGSGLGLHLVYNLVTQALGGSIRVKSEPDKGAIFEICFPISEQLL